MRKVYGKLVRDRIPEMIAAQGETPIVSTLAPDAYLDALHTKLREEADEYLEQYDVLEICDILEVLRAILKAKGVSWDQIESMRMEKLSRNGAFDKRIQLEAVES